MFENHPTAALRITPGDGTSGVANHVASAAFEALLVVEQNTAVVCGHKQPCRTRRDTSLSGTAATNFAINSDVRFLGDPEVNRVHPIFKANGCTPTHTAQSRTCPPIAAIPTIGPPVTLCESPRTLR